jgi:hypothetical protein
MNCPLQSESTLDVLVDYSAGRLDRVRSALLERHMKSCAGCAAFRAEQTALWDALDAWEPAPVSPGFNRSLWQRIAAIAAEPWYRRAWKPAFPLAAAGCVIMAGFLLDHSHDAASGGATAASAVSVAELDRAEKTLDDIQLLRRLDSASHRGTD